MRNVKRSKIRKQMSQRIITRDDLKSDLDVLILEKVSGSTNVHPRFDDSADPLIYGVDAFNFNAFPSGYRYQDGTFQDAGYVALFMTSVIDKTVTLNSESNSVSLQTEIFDNRGAGSIRLVRLCTTDELLYLDGQIIENAFTDYDGNVYSGTKIGTQVWTRENLTVTKLANGDAIPMGFNDLDWSNLTTKAYATPQEAGYGLLYNFYAISGLIVDADWHVPTNLEFTTLTSYIESLPDWDNTNVGKSLKSIRQVNSTFVSNNLKPLDPYLLDANYFVNLPKQSLTGLELKGVAQSLVDGIKGGVVSAGDTLAKLYALISNKLDATKLAIEVLLTGEITTHTHQPYPQTDLATASGTITLATNTVTNLTDTSTGTFTIAFGAAATNKANDYGFIIRIGATLRTVNWDAGIVWKDGAAPTLAINKSYYFVSSKLGTQYLTAFNTY